MGSFSRSFGEPLPGRPCGPLGGFSMVAFGAEASPPHGWGFRGPRCSALLGPQRRRGKARAHSPSDRRVPTSVRSPLASWRGDMGQDMGRCFLSPTWGPALHSRGARGWVRDSAQLPSESLCLLETWAVEVRVCLRGPRLPAGPDPVSQGGLLGARSAPGKDTADPRRGHRVQLCPAMGGHGLCTRTTLGPCL